jgi:hypothetical protein
MYLDINNTATYTVASWSIKYPTLQFFTNFFFVFVLNKIGIGLS